MNDKSTSYSLMPNYKNGWIIVTKDSSYNPGIAHFQRNILPSMFFIVIIMLSLFNTQYLKKNILLHVYKKRKLFLQLCSAIIISVVAWYSFKNLYKASDPILTVTPTYFQSDSLFYEKTEVPWCSIDAVVLKQKRGSFKSNPWLLFIKRDNMTYPVANLDEIEASPYALTNMLQRYTNVEIQNNLFMQIKLSYYYDLFSRFRAILYLIIIVILLVPIYKKYIKKNAGNRQKNEKTY